MSTPKAFTYQTLHAMLKSKDMINIANNTIAYRDNKFYPEQHIEFIGVNYHGNLIAQVYPDKITIYNQSYFTFTTKERLNWLLLPIGYKLVQKDSKWWLYDENKPVVYPTFFVDGLTVYNDHRYIHDKDYMPKPYKKPISDNCPF